MGLLPRLGDRYKAGCRRIALISRDDANARQNPIEKGPGIAPRASTDSMLADRLRVLLDSGDLHFAPCNVRAKRSLSGFLFGERRKLGLELAELFAGGCRVDI